MRTNVAHALDSCAIEVAIEVVGGRWKLAILSQLFTGTKRFGELRRALPAVTQRMLTRQLRELEADGLVTRTIYREIPPKVEYSLTEIGRSLEQTAKLLDEWGNWYRTVVRETTPTPPGADGPDAGRPATGTGG
jgi:DNA-binding HxlR family transcriptional regulator